MDEAVEKLAAILKSPEYFANWRSIIDETIGAMEEYQAEADEETRRARQDDLETYRASRTI